MKKLIQIQFFVLLIGTVFAWSNFATELFAWLNRGDCAGTCGAGIAAANPFLTPCFYGAAFFTAAFVLSLLLLAAARSRGPAPAPAPPADSGNAA